MERTPLQRSTTTAQLRLLEKKRAELETPRPVGVGPDDGLANDLAGIRFVLRAALLAGGLTEAEREKMERSEREARDLLRRTVAGTGGAGGGGLDRDRAGARSAARLAGSGCHGSSR